MRKPTIFKKDFYRTIYNKLDDYLQDRADSFSRRIALGQSKRELFFGKQIQTMSADEIFLMQCNGMWLNRPDLAIRHMAIRDICDGKDDTAQGIRIYRKFWGNDGQDDEELVHNLRQLIDSWSQHGYLSDSYIRCDKKGEIFDGGHRLALALYKGGTEQLKVKRTITNWKQGSMWARMERNGLTEEEIKFVMEYGERLVEEAISRQPPRTYNKKALSKYVVKEYRKVYEFDKKRLNGNSLLTLNHGRFYQSFPLLEIEGRRPTDARISAYGLWDEIGKDADVLDIGCNMGFIDMTVAPKVHSITGIEYNKKGAELALATAKKLGIYNATFIGGDFKEWHKTNRHKYSVIFSFAVHFWLGLEPKVYADMLNQIITPKGKIFFESQGIGEQEDRFAEFLQAFKDVGFEIAKRQIIKDDGETEREWVLLEKIK